MRDARLSFVVVRRWGTTDDADGADDLLVCRANDQHGSETATRRRAPYKKTILVGLWGRRLRRLKDQHLRFEWKGMPPAGLSRWSKRFKRWRGLRTGSRSERVRRLLCTRSNHTIRNSHRGPNPKLPLQRDKLAGGVKQDSPQIPQYWYWPSPTHAGEHKRRETGLRARRFARDRSGSGGWSRWGPRPR